MSELVLAAVATELLSRLGYATSTLKSYELTLLPLLQQQGHLPMKLLSRGVLEDYLNSLKHLSYSTHRRHQAILQSHAEDSSLRGLPRTTGVAYHTCVSVVRASVQDKKSVANHGISLQPLHSKRFGSFGSSSCTVRTSRVLSCT